MIFMLSQRPHQDKATRKMKEETTRRLAAGAKIFLAKEAQRGKRAKKIREIKRRLSKKILQN